jgi:hypothetical protein
MRNVGVWDFVRRLFSSSSAEEEAAKSEEYGVIEREHAPDRAGRSSFADAEAAEATEDELEEFKTPRDPAP